MSHQWDFSRIPKDSIDLFGCCPEEKADEIIEELLDGEGADFTLEDPRKDLDEDDRLTWDTAKALRTCLLQGLSYRHLRSKTLKAGLDFALLSLPELETMNCEPLAEETQFDPIVLYKLLPGVAPPSPAAHSPLSKDREAARKESLKQALALGLKHVAMLVGDGKRIDEEEYGMQAIVLSPAQILELCGEMEKLAAMREDTDPWALHWIAECFVPALREAAEDGDWLHGNVG